MRNYDLIIIGGGPGGYTAADEGARAGLKVLLIEKENLGGVCLNEGCVPTKSMLNSAKIYSHAKNGSRMGIICNDVKMDHLIALVGPLLKILHVFRSIDRGGLGENLLFTVNPVNIIGHQVDPVAVCPAVEHNVERIIVHVIARLEFVTEITGAVCAEDDATAHVRRPSVSFISILLR